MKVTNIRKTEQKIIEIYLESKKKTVHKVQNKLSI